MQRTWVWLTVGCCLGAAASIAGAQQGKAGLWDLTTMMTFQQSPLPPGSPAADAASHPHTRQICVTQQQISKYGAILPQAGPGCHLANVVKSAHSMRADMICAGQIDGTGAIESTFSAESASGRAHFAGSITQGPFPIPIEWTANITADFKSADCGDIKPEPMPAPEPGK